MSLSRSQRENLNVNELLEDEETSLQKHIEQDEYEWSVEIANNIAQIGFKEDDRSTTNKFIEEVYRPLIQTFHENVEWVDSRGPGTEPSYDTNAFDNLDIDYKKWRKSTEEWEETNHGQHISPKSDRITEMRRNFEDFSNSKDVDIDIVSGPLTGGMAPALALEDIYEQSKLDLPQYSPYREEHNDVGSDIDPSEIEGSNVIIVDDMIETGQTIETLTNYYKENGAEEVYISAAMVHSKFDGDIEDGKIYESEEIF